MRAGALDRRVSVQRRTLTSSPSGEPIEAWAQIGNVRWALRMPLTGFERYTSAALEAKEQVEFRLRWSHDLADLQPSDRIVESATPPTPGSVRDIYDIFAVHEIGRHEVLRVLCSRETVTNP